LLAYSYANNSFVFAGKTAFIRIFCGIFYVYTPIHKLNTSEINMPRISSPLALEHILLGCVSQRPMYGYDLHRVINQPAGIGLLWQIKQSQLYALLEKLEAGGLLQSSLVPGEAHLLRKEYSLTPAGRAAFEEWVRSPVPHTRDMRQEFLARLYFARQNGKDSAIALLQRQNRICTQWLESLNGQMESFNPQQDYERCIFRFRIVQIEAILSWLNECERELD
jgi:PadR family transcriptional regulator, regulatory protein AphA